MKKISSLLRNELRESVKGIIQNRKTPGRMSDSGLGVQHGFAKRIFVLSVPMIDAITAFPPAGGFAVAGVFGLSHGLLNSDADVVIFYASSWAEFHAEGLETVVPHTDYKRKIETYHWVMDRQKPTTEKRWVRSRRSQRIELNVPLVVYRARGEGPQFYESTETLVVNAHGALIALTDLVAPWQKLRMQNLDTGENLECRVVSVKKAQIGPPRVAVEFMQATPDFWRIAFPPADWKSAV